MTEYDILGRVKRQSVPTEVDGSWDPAGDDATRGFLWTYQKYDWMGRVVRKINTDGTDSSTLNDSDVLISYAGCGCAGGLVTTIEGELVPRTDTTGNARRKQKSYADILGRTFKAETYEWDGTSVYSTVSSQFNGRDQVLRSRQYAGTDSSTTFQDTLATFDGHGRLKTSHRPEQRDSSNDPAFTTYNYNKDDSISSVTDARGAVTSYTYENNSGTPLRPLVTGIAWTVPGGSGIEDPADVSFTFDNLGNRTQMTDGLGTVVYEYDPLSRLTAEERDFTDTLENAPNSVFRLEYTYTIGGAVKSFTDPYGDEQYYSFDKLSRLGGVTGSEFASTTTYASNLAYRAWGALKHLEYGSGYQMSLAYNNILAPDSQLTNNIGTPSIKIFDRSYDYNADGRLKLADEESSSNNQKFDRAFTYDHQGRIKDAKSGVEAHGSTETDLEKLPYRQSYSYNALGNLTGRDSTLWDYAGSWNFSNTIENNRLTTGAFYDNDGRRTYGDGVYFKFDAAGAMHETTRTANYETKLYQDGLGRESKRSQRTWDAEEEEYGEWDSKYLIHSSVFGRIITEAEKTGRKWRTFVMANGSSIARQSKTESGSASLVTFEYREASGLSAGNVVSPTSDFAHAYLREELDGLGNNVGHVAVENPLDEARNSQSPIDRMAFESMDMGFCNRGGLFGPCDIVSNLDNLSSDNDNWIGFVNGNWVGELFKGQFNAHLGSARQNWITMFSHGNLLPLDVGGRRKPNRNNAQAIAHEIMQSLGFEPLHLLIGNLPSDRGGSRGYGPIDEGFNTYNVLDHLSPCVAKLFQPYFSEYDINGVMVNIPNQAAFIQGIPKIYSLVITPQAVMLGPYNIHYDTSKVSLSSPTWDNLLLIAEELSHAEQFLKMWQDMPNVPQMPGSIRQGTTSSPPRRPNYEEAKASWATKYAAASVIAVSSGQDSYFGNSYEIDAQANARRIINDLGKKHPQQYAAGLPLCP